MSEYTSYYLYQKYEKRGSQDWIPCVPSVFSISGDSENPMPLVEKSSADTACGYNPSVTTYRWVNLDPSVDYYCSGTTKYYKQQKQVSYNGGQTWSNVVPAEYQMGASAETQSSDCTPSYIYRWVNLDPTVDYYCSGTTKYYKQQKQQSADQGQTWENVSPAQYQYGQVYEQSSTDCGYVPPTPTSGGYLTFVAQEDGTFKFSGTTSANTVQYSLDSGTTWTSLANNANSPTVTAGNEIWWKGNCTPETASPYGIGNFSSTSNFAVKGNAMSLLYGDDFNRQTSLSGKNYAFVRLFYGCNGLTSAENLMLPTTTLSTRCYYGMFEDCTSLTTVPDLPATTLAEGCYYNMFKGCTSLTIIPSDLLPTTTMAASCYSGMFNGCTSLTTAPVLPATTLATYCYRDMFVDCTSLTTAPSLPATTLTNYCYQQMFEGCSGLTTAPELPATALADLCYYGMFIGCTSLTTVPSDYLPATTLARDCYNKMFRYCTSLTVAPSLPATTLAQNCYYSMFENCTSLTTVPQLPATTLASQCYRNMFQSCTSLTTVPSNMLPATTLVGGCYRNMFSWCSSLTTAPELPATTLADYCYTSMFAGCSPLNSITCLATDISATECTYHWVYGVASSGTFVKDASMSSWPSGTSGIPNNWTIQNA